MSVEEMWDRIEVNDDLKALTIGMPRLISNLRETLYRGLYAPVICAGGEMCQMGRLVVLLDERYVTIGQKLSDILVPVAEFEHSLPPTTCEGCRKRCVTEYLAGRLQFWHNLPGYFSCANWETLRKQLNSGEQCIPLSDSTPHLPRKQNSRTIRVMSLLLELRPRGHVVVLHLQTKRSTKLIPLSLLRAVRV